MLGNKAFYNATIKKYVVAFAKIFGDINVFRFKDQDLKVYDEYHVPILYQHKDKMYQIRQMSQPSAGISNVYPRMTFNIKSAVFDPERVENKYNKMVECPSSYDVDRLKRIYVGRPYNFKFTLNVFTRNEDDKFMILEQILSFFNPELVRSIIEVPEIGLRRDVKFEIDEDIDFGFSDDAVNLYEIEDNDYSVMSIGFTCYGYVYPPVKSEPIIKNIIIGLGVTDMDDINADVEIFEEITITGGDS